MVVKLWVAPAKGGPGRHGERQPPAAGRRPAHSTLQPPLPQLRAPVASGAVLGSDGPVDVAGAAPPRPAGLVCQALRVSHVTRQAVVWQGARIHRVSPAEAGSGRGTSRGNLQQAAQNMQEASSLQMPQPPASQPGGIARCASYNITKS